jgi:hypothetical protein
MSYTITNVAGYTLDLGDRQLANNGTATVEYLTNKMSQYRSAGLLSVSADASPFLVGSNSKLARSASLYRKMAQNEVMAVPPTITVNAVGAGTWTAATVQTPANSAVRAEGGDIYKNVANFYVPRQPNNTTGAATDATTTVWRWAFDFDGQVFDVNVHGTAAASAVRVWSDGQAAALAPTLAGTDAVEHWVTVDFGSRALRRIVIEVVGYSKGLRVGPTDAIHAPSTLLGPKVALLHDSYGAGVGASNPIFGFAPILARLCGLPGLSIFAIPGTGFDSVAQGGAATQEYGASARLGFLTAFAPDALIIPGSINDGVSGTAATTVGPKIDATITAIRSALPNIPILMTSALRPDAGALAFGTTAVYQAKATQYGATFVDATGWFTGTGKVGATTGTGTADNARASDGNHPTDVGHRGYGSRFAPYVSTFLGQQV